MYMLIVLDMKMLHSEFCSDLLMSSNILSIDGGD